MHKLPEPGFRNNQFPPKWLPLPKAARRLGIRFDSAVSLVHSGYIVGHLVWPNRWFIRADSLERYLRWRDRQAA